MHFPRLIGCIVGTITSIVSDTNALVVKRCISFGYGTFYNDNACRDGGGTAFSINNDGCIANQIGKNSIYVQYPCQFKNDKASLVWSPGTDCNCQNHCEDVRARAGSGNYCWNLNGAPFAQSFRFIEQGCGRDNC